MVLAFAGNLFYRLLQMLDSGCWILDTLFSMVIGVRSFLDYPASVIQ
jgi:hypothetical protein